MRGNRVCERRRKNVVKRARRLMPARATVLLALKGIHWTKDFGLIFEFYLNWNDHFS